MAKTRDQKKPATKHRIGDPRTVVNVKPDDVPTFYVNVVNVETTTHDIKLRFGQVQTTDDTTIEVAQTAFVYMAYSHARAFANVLNAVLARVPVSAGIVAPTPSDSDTTPH